MREATAAEYNRVTMNGKLEKKIMPHKRCCTIAWSYCGTPVAEKTEILSRGKIQSVSYMINPDFLSDSSE